MAKIFFIWLILNFCNIPETKVSFSRKVNILLDFKTDCSGKISQIDRKMKAFKFLLFALVVASAAFSSCKKSGPAEAMITVVDSTGQRISGALVTLSQDSVINPVNNVQASANQVKQSDAAGQAFFSFKLEAVLNVEVVKGTKVAKDYIRLEQSKTITKTVVIR
jgi:hypothetical protein